MQEIKVIASSSDQPSATKGGFRLKFGTEITHKTVAGGDPGCLLLSSSPDDIRATLKMSKKVFKKAIGGLYKERRITLSNKGIALP